VGAAGGLQCATLHRMHGSSSSAGDLMAVVRFADTRWLTSGWSKRAARADLAALASHLVQVEAWIASGLLDGVELNAADFQIAPCNRALALPGGSPGIHRPSTRGAARTAGGAGLRTSGRSRRLAGRMACAAPHGGRPLVRRHWIVRVRGPRAKRPTATAVTAPPAALNPGTGRDRRLKPWPGVARGACDRIARSWRSRSLPRRRAHPRCLRFWSVVGSKASPP
jgi:hypothetical protein